MLTAERAPEVAGGVQLRPARTVLVNHFWVGVGEAAQPEARNGAGRKSGNGAARANGSGAKRKQKAAADG
jgi:hypothetical protein